MEYTELKVLRFDVLKVELGKRKLCECEQPQYTIDPENRLVTCCLCGAIVDPYDALFKFATQYENYAQQQKQIIAHIQALNEECENLRGKRQQLTIFKDMASQYRQGMLPYCPSCGAMIDPTKITAYINKGYYERRNRNGERRESEDQNG